MFNKDHLYDELRRIEQDVVRGEQQLAEQEDLLVSLKTQNKTPRKLRGFSMSYAQDKELFKKIALGSSL